MNNQTALLIGIGVGALITLVIISEMNKQLQQKIIYVSADNRQVNDNRQVIYVENISKEEQPFSFSAN